MNKLYLTLALLCILIDVSLAQDSTVWQSITDETLYLASTAKADMGFSNDKDRALINVSLPQGTIGYAIRVTVNCSSNNTNFITSLENIPSPEIKAAAIVSSLLLNGDGNQCDVFIFPDKSDAQNFVNKFAIKSCNSYNQIAHISKYDNSCLNMVSIGFRNNNMLTGLHVKVELAALIDSKNNASFAKENKDSAIRNSYKEDVYKFIENKDYQGIINYSLSKIEAGYEYPEFYDNLGWYCLITKQYTKAHHYLEKAAQKYPENLYVQCRYAHALLLSNNYEQAIKIYSAHLDENVNAQISWKKFILNEIEKLQKEGVKNEHFDEILNMMK